MVKRSHQDEILKVLRDAIIEDDGILSPAVIAFVHQAAVRPFRWVNAYSGELPREYIQAGAEILGDPTWFYPLVTHYGSSADMDLPYLLKGNFFTRTDPNLLRVVEEVNRTLRARDVRIFSEPAGPPGRSSGDMPPGDSIMNGWALLPDVFQDDTGIEFMVYKPSETTSAANARPGQSGVEGPSSGSEDPKDPLGLFLRRIRKNEL